MKVVKIRDDDKYVLVLSADEIYRIHRTAELAEMWLKERTPIDHKTWGRVQDLMGVLRNVLDV